METWQVALLFAVNVTVLIGGLAKGVKVLIDMRDDLRDLIRDVGTPDPPSGLFKRMTTYEKELLSHRDSLIELTSEFGLRRPGGRS